MKFIDIGANLTDPMYQGTYHGSQKHEPDLDSVLERAWNNGVDKIMITGGSLEDSRKAIDLALTHVGCHPTRCQEFEAYESGPDGYLQALSKLIEDSKSNVVALGELGLDYDRLEFCPKETQKKYFARQLEIVDSLPLPLFLHCRNSAQDLIDILKSHRDSLRGGVVHSFDGTLEEAKSIIELGYFIGLNGCSLKSDANLAVVKEIPSDKLMIETDCPWCEVRPSHASSKYLDGGKFEVYPSVKKEKWKSGHMIKSRNEPCNIVNILKIIANVKEEEESALADLIYDNTAKVFFNL